MEVEKTVDEDPMVDIREVHIGVSAEGKCYLGTIDVKRDGEKVDVRWKKRIEATQEYLWGIPSVVKPGETRVVLLPNNKVFEVSVIEVTDKYQDSLSEKSEE